MEPAEGRGAQGDAVAGASAEPKRDSRPRTVTTTHGSWGAGHPRILATSDHGRYVHEIDCDLTHIGSSPESDLVLPATDPLHAKILHDTTDEYVLTMVGEGATSHGRHAMLRTGARFTAGPWQLVFARDEFADHGRPYGGRRGGELAHQRREAPRPNYAEDHPASSLTRCALKRPEEASTPDQIRALGQAVLEDGRADAAGGSLVDLRLINDEIAGIYEATAGDTEVGGVTYNRVGDGRIVLLAVSVFPRFRGKGIANELIRRVLDDVRAQGKTITNYCPVVRTFIEHHPDYADVIDPDQPGVFTSRST
jgi:predicted GNAT family acetyltransferase